MNFKWNLLNMQIISKYYRQIILFGLFWALSVTVLRALRWPNDWAEAHWLINYEFGFIKRALPGAMIAHLGSPESVNEYADLIKLASSSLLVLFSFIFLWICVRIVLKMKFDINSVLTALVFLTSPYIVMSAHLNGYYDNIIMITSVLACLLIRRGCVLLPSIVISVGIFVHETIFLVGFPTVIFFALIRYLEKADDVSVGQLFTNFIVEYKILLFPPVAILLYFILHQRAILDSEMIRDQLIMYLSGFDFIQYKRNIIVPVSFTTSFFEYINIQSPHFISRIFDPAYVFRIGPPLLVLLNCCWLCVRKSHFKILIFISLVVSTLLPLSLHVIAWDTSRIWTYPLGVAVLSLWGIGELASFDEVRRKAFIYYVPAIVVVLLQLFVSIPLMDGAHERFSSVSRALLYMPLLVTIGVIVFRQNISYK